MGTATARADVFARNLSRALAARGVSQGHLGAAAGLSRSAVSRIVTGQQEPKVGVAAALARALGVPLDELAGGAAGEAPGGSTPGPLTGEELDLIRVARRLGVAEAFDRVIGRPPA